MGLLGTPVPRIEDRTLLTAGGTFVDDLPLAGAAHLVIVRSAVAHGRLRGIDAAAARAAPGVLRVVTAADLDLAPLAPEPPLLRPEMPQPVLATDLVRYVGEPVAAVVAASRAEAADAAALVRPDIEPLPPLLDVEESLAGERLLHEAAGTNVALALKFARPLRGDTLDGCEVVVRLRIRNQRVAACPLEVRAAAAEWDGGRLTHRCGSQSVHLWRDQLARSLGVPAEQVRVVTPDVGGAFGSKAYPAPEDVLVAALARLLGRPVRWVETRSESMTGLGHGRAQLQDVELGGTRDGRLQAYRLSVVQDAGAYPRVGAVLPFWTRTMLTGPYGIERARFTSSSVVTTTAPVVAYRGAGQPEAVAALERAVDAYAAEIGMDPAELRRRNLVPADALPYTTLTRTTYDSGDYPAALETALATAGYPGLRAEQRRRRESGDPRQLGIGLSSYVEATGGDVRPEWASIRVGADGGARIRTGTSPHGQGHATSWAMIAADRLGIPVDRITVEHGDTDRIPTGGGTGGSRSLQTGGAAVHGAAGALADVARGLAAEALEARAEDLVLDAAAGRFHLRGDHTAGLGWGQLADAVGPDRLVAEHTFTPGAATYPYGTHLAVVEVDTETGAVTLLRVVAVDDAGRVVNPLIVEGQLHGGLAQGASQALYEEVRYAEDGRLVTGSLGSYPLPSAADLPSFETVLMQTPTPANELGAKGVGESGAVGCPPAVQNAVVDALAHLGVRHLDMPATPERVWRAIEDARSA